MDDLLFVEAKDINLEICSMPGSMLDNMQPTQQVGGCAIQNAETLHMTA